MHEKILVIEGGMREIRLKNARFMTEGRIFLVHTTKNVDVWVKCKIC